MRMIILISLLCGCGSQQESLEICSSGSRWPSHVSVRRGEDRVDVLAWPDRAKVSTDGGKTFEVYEPGSIDEQDLAPYADLLEAATDILTNQGVEGLEECLEFEVGAAALQSPMITGSEAYWCGVGTAGAMIVGTPVSAFFYAVACGMWADMDTW